MVKGIAIALGYLVVGAIKATLFIAAVMTIAVAIVIA